MISAVDLRSGMYFVMDNDLYKVMEASHHKPGKGNTVMRVKIKNLRTGATTETTFRPDEKFERAYLDSRDVTYLYTAGDDAVFMDTETYEQYELPVASVEDELKYIVENMTLSITFYQGELVGVNLPNTVNLRVDDTEPRIKGATASGTSGKPATLETGLVVQVPDFIEKDEVIEVNTSNGEYKGRVRD